ncbi:MAG: zinc-ribbon domain-containing protein [Bacillus sp. (in: firmicutes)]
MYCQKCGWRVENDSAVFCQKCGAKLIDDQAEVISSDPTELGELGSSRGNKKKHKGSSHLWPIVAPVASLVLASGIGYYYYHSQIELNNEVERLLVKAEQTALSGDYEEALEAIEKASAIRPTYELLDEMKALIEQAQTFEDSFKNIDGLLKKQNFNEAEIEIANLEELLEDREGPLFSEFSNRILEKQNQLSIAKIRKEIENLNTVEQLGVKLQSLSSVNHEDKEEVAKLIKSKIVSIAIDKAQVQLNDKQFDYALDIVEDALYYASGDEQLLSFKERIIEEQTAYEKAEMNRIEQEMVEAAQEDLKNKTAAVSIESVDAYIDEYGDLHVSGKVKNTATVPISSIELSYIILSTEGEKIITDMTYVEPFILKPGEVGTFYELHSGVYEKGTVEITGAVWKLDEGEGAE